MRSAAIYLFLMLLFRVSGRRTMSQITTFDLVLLLIISEATQQGLLGDDFSVTNAMLIIVTLVTLDLAMSVLQRHFRAFDKFIDGVPLVIVADGQPLEDRMRSARIDVEDVLEQARLSQGVERLEQIRYAVLERGGAISVIVRT